MNVPTSTTKLVYICVTLEAFLYIHQKLKILIIHKGYYIVVQRYEFSSG